MANLPTILLFDSGLGGLTVFREVVEARPDARYVYLADDARFPYGEIAETELVTRIVTVVGDALAAHKPDIAIIACNTASTLALAPLREKFTVPFIGTVPAIKPACSQSKSKRVSVLGTQATVGREYTRALIREFGFGCDVKLVGATRLATYAEAELNGAPVADDAVAAEIAPCFVEDGTRTDAVVLACTHYPLLLARLRQLSPWPVDWIDPAPAIARRLVELIGPGSDATPAATAQIIFTSGRPTSAALAKTLAGFGFREKA